MAGSRVSQNIRQEKGIAYWAASELWHCPGLGLWLAFSPVQVDQTGVAMREFQKELRGLAAGKPTTQLELEEAKSNVIRGLPKQFEMVWAAVEQVARAWAWELPMTDFQTLPERI